jgi:hypothetical protein
MMSASYLCLVNFPYKQLRQAFVSCKLGGLEMKPTRISKKGEMKGKYVKKKANNHKVNYLL